MLTSSSLATRLSPSQVGIIAAAESPTTTVGTLEQRFTIESDSVLFSIFSDILPSGTLVVSFYTEATEDSDVFLGSVSLTEPTSELVRKQFGSVLQRLKVRVEYPVGCTFDIRAKSISAGETSTKILGATNARNYQTSIDSSEPQVLIPASLGDRAGLVFRNFSASAAAILYIGFTEATTSEEEGYPLTVGEALAMDIAGGVAIYGIAAADTSVDLRILEAAN